MDHVVYLDSTAKELDLLLSGKKTMLIRGATGRKIPYGRVNPEDLLTLINNNAEGLILAKARVKSVFNSEKMTADESTGLIESHHGQLQLTKKQFERWAGKRYLVLIEISDLAQLEPFQIDKSAYGNLDDWLPVEKIENVRVNK